MESLLLASLATQTLERLLVSGTSGNSASCCQIDVCASSSLSLSQDLLKAACCERNTVRIPRPIQKWLPYLRPAQSPRAQDVQRQRRGEARSTLFQLVSRVARSHSDPTLLESEAGGQGWDVLTGPCRRILHRTCISSTPARLNFVHPSPTPLLFARTNK